MQKKLHVYVLHAIRILGIVGVLLAVFLSITHYTGTPGEACPKHKDGVPICDIVNQSIYSEILGIPLAIIAIFVYALYSIFAHLLLHSRKQNTKNSKRRANYLGYFFSSSRLQWALVSLSSISLVFAGYLIYILYAVLETACVYCIAAHTLTFTIFVLSWVSFSLSEK